MAKRKNLDYIGNINEVEIIKAFSAAKRDIKANANQFISIKNEIKNINSNLRNAVSIEKFNLLKIKLGELNDNLKAILDIQKKINNLEKNFKKEFATQKNFTDKTNELNSRLIELKSDYVSQLDLKKMMDDVSEEFNFLRRDATAEYKKVMNEILELKNVKDTITYDELIKTTKRLDKRIDSEKKKIDLLNEKSKKFIVDAQIDSLIADTTKEFNAINKSIKLLNQNVKEERNNIKKELKNKVELGQLKDVVDNVNKEFEEVYDDLKEINFVKKQLTGIIRNTIKKDEFAKTKKHLEKRCEFVKEETNFIKKNFAREKDLKNMEKRIDKVSSEKLSSLDYKKEKELMDKKIKELEDKLTRMQKNKYPIASVSKLDIFSNILVVLSYIPLIILIVSYVLGNVIWLKELVISAVVLFGLGFLIKIIKAKR